MKRCPNLLQVSAQVCCQFCGTIVAKQASAPSVSVDVARVALELHASLSTHGWDVINTFDVVYLICPRCAPLATVFDEESPEERAEHEAELPEDEP